MMSSVSLQREFECLRLSSWNCLNRSVFFVLFFLDMCQSGEKDWEVIQDLHRYEVNSSAMSALNKKGIYHTTGLSKESCFVLTIIKNSNNKYKLDKPHCPHIIVLLTAFHYVMYICIYKERIYKYTNFF